MFSLDDARLFSAVAVHGGFSAASRVTGHPKSTLSKRVAALEGQLGLRLLNRNARGLSLTEAGEEFRRHIAAMLIEAETAEARLKGLLAEPNGIVRMTASAITAQHHLSAVLPIVAEELPKVRIMLHATDRQVDLVQEAFDLALRDHHAPLPPSDLLQRRVGYEPDYLVSAPSYIERAGMPTAPEELVNHDGLMNGPIVGPLAWRLEDGDRVASVAPGLRLFADDPVTIVQAALRGLGIAALPRVMCAEHIDRGTMVRVLPEWTAGGATTTLLMPHRRGQLPAIRALADLLVRQLRKRLVPA